MLLHTILQPRGVGVRFLEVVVALSIKEFEHRRPKLTSRERREINSRTRMYLFIKTSRVLLLGVRLREEPLTYYVIRNSLKYGRYKTFYIPKCEHFPLLVCPLRFLVISVMRRLGVYNIRVSLLSFLPRQRPRLSGLPHFETFSWRIVTPTDRVTLPGRPDMNSPVQFQ